VNTADHSIRLIQHRRESCSVGNVASSLRTTVPNPVNNVVSGTMTTTNDWEREDDPPEYDQKEIPLEVRRAVLARDSYRCRRCGEQDTGKLHLHHVTYRSQGGDHNPDNLVTVCFGCHRLIHDKKVTVKRVLGRWFFGAVFHWRRHL
jgi:5-methylcytosine-specific restriction endonuclease McrA